MSKDALKSIKLYQWISIGVVTLFFLIVAGYYFNSFSHSKEYKVPFNAIETEMDEAGNAHLILRNISLKRGDYNMSVMYVAPNDINVRFVLENDVVIFDTYTDTNGEIAEARYDFSIKTGTDRGRFEFASTSWKPVALAFITITSDKPIFYDGLIWGILALLMIPVSIMAIYFFGKSTHKKSLVLTVLLVIIQLLPFLINRGLLMGVDTKAHMMRVEGIYYGLLDGQFEVVVQPEWNNSYGQIGVLYPNLFLYIPALFRVIGMSQLGACKLYFFMVILGGSAIALACARTIFKKDWQIAICTALILLGNMRLHDMYAGGKIGGSLLAETFWPLVVAGLIEVFYHNYKKWYLLAFGLAGVICCHVTSASVAFIMLVIFTLISCKRLANKNVLKGIGLAVLLFTALVLGTVVAFLKFYFGDWGQGALQWRDFLTTLWSLKDPFMDGRWTSVILVCLLSYVILIRGMFSKKLSALKGGYVIPSLITATILVWMTTAYFPWKWLMNIGAVRYYTNMLQSGNRFLSLAGCLIAFCIPALLDWLIPKVDDKRFIKSKTTLIVCIVLTGLVIFNFASEAVRYLNNDIMDIMYYDEVIGEVEYQFEDYLPANTESEWYESDASYISNEEDVTSLLYETNGTHVFYSYLNTDPDAYVEFSKFYYDGYVAYDENNDPIPVTKGDKNRVKVNLKTTRDNPASIHLWYKVSWKLILPWVFSYGIWIAALLILVIKLFKRAKY